MPNRCLISIMVVLGSLSWARAQTGPQTPAPTSDMELVKDLIAQRANYKKTLEQLRDYYYKAGDLERAKMAELELVGWYRARKDAFIEDFDVPGPHLRGTVNVAEANKLITEAMRYMNKGRGTKLDNQRWAEVLLQEVLAKYPQSDKISKAAYLLGEIYESDVNQMYQRAAWYYTRSFQWNPANSEDARLRAARIYDKKLHDRSKALELYRDVLKIDVMPSHHDEANKRIAELSKH